MRTITQQELKVIVDSHKAWLTRSTGGMKADLSFFDLHSTDLRHFDLRFANLSFSDLNFADLRFSDLHSTDLRRSDLRSADLSFADLSSADLRDADLRLANLDSTNLNFAILDKKYVSISCIGSRRGMTTYCVDEDKIWCGCWNGTLKNFEDRVKEVHKDNPQFLKEYLDAIQYFQSFKSG